MCSTMLHPHRQVSDLMCPSGRCREPHEHGQSAEIPWLRAVRVKADGALEALDDAADRPAPVSPQEIVEGRIVLLAQLLGLLVAFIGGNLTLQLVGEIWPKVALDDLDFGNGGKNEKAK
jgi:hypothetical protein